MGTKYVTVAVSGYNASPPADDGSQSASNQVTWANNINKIGDPIKNALTTMNSELVTAMDKSARLITSSDTAVAGDHDKIIQVSSTTSPAISVTLSDAATMAAGYIVTINNQSSTYGVTLLRATGADTIDGVAATNVIPVNASWSFAVNSAATGYITLDKKGFGQITNALSGNVALNNTANYFDGPSIAQGTTGTWFVSGTVTVHDTAGAATFFAKLWDGTTVIAASQNVSAGASSPTTIALSGYLASPAGNLRISVRDASSTSGLILFNNTGLSKDSVLSAIRIA